jgi:hypothetical protein
MKIKYFVILFVLFCLSCSQTKYFVSTDERNEKDGVMYKIRQIENYGLFDLIYAQKNDSLFKIISLSDTISKLQPLIIGERYQLDLIQIYPNSAIEKTVSDAKIGARDSCFMSIEKKSHNSLYFATNLNGSFLSENSKGITAVTSKFSIYTIFCDACKNNKFLLRLYLK